MAALVLFPFLASLAPAALAPALTGFRLDDPSAHPPALLSATGLFRNIAPGARRLSDSLHAFDVNVPLWSDGAFKERWLYLPAGSRVIPADTANYVFPDGAVLIKTFYADTAGGDPAGRAPVETRFLVVNRADGYTYYSGLTYRWRSDGTDADLVPEDGMDAVVAGKPWRYPSRMECNRCHVPENRGVLGFITPQLDRPSAADPERNQLQVLADAGVLTANPLEGRHAARWPGLGESGAPVEARARAYLAANCSHCHGNRYENHSVISFEYFDPGQSDVYSALNYRGYVGLPHEGDSATPFFIYPGRPDSSYVLRRMSARGSLDHGFPEQMPPLATYAPDTAALGLLREWVRGMAPTDLRPRSQRAGGRLSPRSGPGAYRRPGRSWTGTRSVNLAGRALRNRAP